MKLASMPADPAIADLSFEDALRRLEEIVHRLNVDPTYCLVK